MTDRASSKRRFMMEFLLFYRGYREERGGRVEGRGVKEGGEDPGEGRREKEQGKGMVKSRREEAMEFSHLIFLVFL